MSTRPLRKRTTTVGVLLLGLVGACSRSDESRVAQEKIRREASAIERLLDAGAEVLSTRSSVMAEFGDGFSLIEFDPPENYKSHAFRWMGQRGHVRVRRVEGPARLQFGGWVNQQVVHTRPSVAAYLNGKLLAPSKAVDEGGVFGLDRIVSEEEMGSGDWSTLAIEVSSIGFHWGNPPELKVANIFFFGWQAAPED